MLSIGPESTEMHVLKSTRKGMPDTPMQNVEPIPEISSVLSDAEASTSMETE